MLPTKFQASEPSGSEDEDFGNFFYVFLFFKPSIPRCGAILDPEIFICTNSVKTTIRFFNIICVFCFLK